jgi:DNA-binding MarR family transcriptional regulator
MSQAIAIDPAIAQSVRRSCLCLRVQRASRAIGRHFDAALRPVGLNNWQFTLLMSLNQSPAPSVNELADQLVMDRTTMTKNLRVLEQRELLAICRDVADGRVKRILLTEAGRDLLMQAMSHWRAANDSVKASLPSGGLSAFRAGLDAIAGQ